MTGTNPAIGRLDGLAREHPDWEPWLALLGRVLREATGAGWTAAVPANPPGPTRRLSWPGR